MVSNRQILQMLDELIELTVLDDGSPQSFRVRAYGRALRSVENLGSEIAVMSARQIQEIPGIGKSIASGLVEFCNTGKLRKLEALRTE